MKAESEVITYRCPNCKALINIASEFVEDRVECPRCDIPFFPAAPRAQPILDEASQQEAQYKIDRPADDETPLKEVHPSMWRQHPFLFGVLWLGVIACVTVAVVFMGQSFMLVSVPALAIAAGILGYFGYWWLEVYATRLIITNKRTTLRKGIIARSTTEVQHDDVRNIQVEQDAWQRIFGVGDLAISSAGQSTLEIYIKGLPMPDEVADYVRSLQ